MKDYRRLLSESGHDPKGIPISYKPWRNMLKGWREQSQVPPHHVKIFFQHPGPAMPETMWCKVLGQRISGYVVRLLNTSLFSPKLRNGTLLLGSVGPSDCPWRHGPANV